MKRLTTIGVTVIAIIASVSTIAQAQNSLPVKPLAPQKQLLKSENKKLEQNKKLVYDMWREFLEGGHMEVADKYFKEDYMQHNPTAATGRKAVVEFFSKFSKPKPVADTIKSSVVSIIAEKDLVMLAFAREMTDPADKSKKYSTTWFDMFRIKDGKIAEHWDCGTK